MSDDPQAPGLALMPARPRFSWLLRVLLFLLVSNMVFRSHMTMLPWMEWMEELGMQHLPDRMLSKQEIARYAEQADANNAHPVRDDFVVVAVSVRDYWRPWPTDKTRERLEGPADWIKFGLCWVNSRFDFVETLVGINQEWPMFSPNVGRKKWLTRVRLIYDDGAQKIVRQSADPEDLTHYSHWFKEKILDYELNARNAAGRETDCLGYCNLLAHHHPVKGDAKLVRIELFEVLYHFCPPDEEDPVAFYQAQNGPPAHQVRPTFFVYDVASKQGGRVRK